MIFKEDAFKIIPKKQNKEYNGSKIHILSKKFFLRERFALFVIKDFIDREIKPTKLILTCLPFQKVAQSMHQRA